MHIDHLTLTGADDGVTLEALRPLVDAHPIVEWAILFSPKHEGHARYPSKSWREALYKAYPTSRMKRAAHVCGASVQAFANGNESLLHELRSHYQRIQINFSAHRTAPETFEQILEQSRRLGHDGIDVIVQHHPGNVDTLDRWLEVPNHAMLFDASGGRGQAPQAWSAPIEGHACGYAGGIRADNVQAVLDALNTVVPVDTHIWIDLETGLRDVSNVWNMGLAQTVIDRTESWLANHHRSHGDVKDDAR